MAASTRSGFTGGFSGGNGPTDVRSAPTLYGHDLHLNRSALEAAPVNGVDESAAPSERPVTLEEDLQDQLDVESPDASRATAPSHTGKSRFPALARLFGRWNTRGEFEADRPTLDLDEIPRERFLRPLAIVVATAAISFFIVVGLLKLRDSTGTAPVGPPVAQPLAQPAPVAAPRVPPAAPAGVVGSTPVPARAPARARDDSGVPEPSFQPPARAVAKRAVQRHRPRSRLVPLDPDGPMPLSF
jgi:hypothetical protein